MAGILKIHSTTAGPLSSGHSWIEYAPIDGRSTTFGTWGNAPTGTGNGLLQDVEGSRQADATRTLIIDDQQEQRLFKVINTYRARGPQAWSLLAPCSSFAAEAWEQATGENLIHQTAGISTPARLAKSIIEANKQEQRVKPGDPDVRLQRPRSKPVSSSTEHDRQAPKQNKRPRRR